MRVCSKHFPDGEPTYQNPYPTLELGYDSSKRENLISPKPRRRILSYTASSASNRNKKSEKNKASCLLDSKSTSSLNIADESLLNPMMSSPNTSSSITNFNISESTPLPFTPLEKDISTNYQDVDQVTNNGNIGSDLNQKKLLEEIQNLKMSLQQERMTTDCLKDEIHQLQLSNNKLTTQLNVTNSIMLKQNNTIKNLHYNASKCKCKYPLYKQLLKSDKKCNFYTGIVTIKQFEVLHDFISPFVQRRWAGPKVMSTKIIRKFTQKPKTFGPNKKLCSKDEFLLMLLKLRQGILTENLADRFGISNGLASSIVTTWVKAASVVLKPTIFVPQKNKIFQTLPNRFKSMPDIHSILDATEVFIETPKNLDLQKITWSDYKHHNTLKLLVSVAPNSSIMFISKAYGGSISDKEITNRSEYLDHVPSYSRIMFDKGFKLNDECAQRLLYYTVPPGRRGAAQMTRSEVRKTKKIANLRILVEQVIRRLKTFRILAAEYPINMLKLIDDVVIICGALTNLRKPIYLD